MQKETVAPTAVVAFLNLTNISGCAELDRAVLRSEYQYQDYGNAFSPRENLLLGRNSRGRRSSAIRFTCV